MLDRFASAGLNAIDTADVYAKGGDYTPEMLAETDAVEEYGGRVAILDYVAERSTTAVVQRIRDGAGAERLTEAADLG